MRCLTEAKDNPKKRDALWQICAEDYPFWLGTFVYTYRPGFDETQWPFIPWEYQLEFAGKVFDAIDNGYDIVVPKSRDMGVTWIVLTAFQHYWLFSDQPVPFICVSRNEDLVDQTGNPDSLLWKFDYALERLPSWMKPGDVESHNMHRQNGDNGCVVDGEATTGDMSAGGRRKAGLFDEFARVEDDTAALSATADAVRSRVFVSTYEGQNNEFHNLVESGVMPVCALHWSRHPEKSRGLYEITDSGDVELKDDFEGEVKLWRNKEQSDNGEPHYETYYYPDEYPFQEAIPEHMRDAYTLRSPWFDSQCCERPSVKEIAENLEMDPMLSGSHFFSTEMIEEQEELTQEPDVVGNIDFTYDPDREKVRQPKFTPNPDGHLRLWYPPTKGRMPQDRNYVIGCDCSEGTNASNSVASIYCTGSGEQVGEYAHPTLTPDEFARHVVALAVWLGGASYPPYLIWEMNGPGLAFGSIIQKVGYKHIYYNRDELAERAKPGQRPGWHSSRNAKSLLLREYEIDRGKGEMIVRSPEENEECKGYVLTDTGRIEAGEIADESTGARESHGDRVIASALARRGLEAQPEPKPAEKRKDPPPGSWEWRRRRAKKRRENADSWKP